MPPHPFPSPQPEPGPEHERPLHRRMLHEVRAQEACDRAEEAAAVIAVAASVGVSPDDPTGFVVPRVIAADVRHAARDAYRCGRASRG